MITEKEYEKKIFDIVSHGHASLVLSIGLELDLFDHVTSAPRTANQIADSAGYRKRYVEAWLKAAAASGLIEANDDGTQFWVQDKYRKYLSFDSFVTTWSRNVPMLAEGYYEVMKCFKHDGPPGVPYSFYPRFSKSMADFSANYQNENRLVSNYLSTVPGLIETLKKGGRHLDVCCGQGLASYVIAKTFPASQSAGVDSLEMSVEAANQRRAEAEPPLTNLTYHLMDAARLPADWSDSFDYVTSFNALTDLCHPEKVLREIYRVLKPGCYYSMIDMNTSSKLGENMLIGTNTTPGSMAAVCYTVDFLHCIPVACRVEGGAGIGIMAGLEVFLGLAKKVGFIIENVQPMPDVTDLNAHCVCKKPPSSGGMRKPANPRFRAASKI